MSFLGSLVQVTLSNAAEHAGAPTINWWSSEGHAPPVGWAFVNFVIFVGLLVYFARKPIRAAFVERHEGVKKAVSESVQLHAKAERDRVEQHHKTAQLDEEVKHLLKQAEQDGQKECERLISQGQDYADRLQHEVKGMINQEAVRMQAKLQEELVLAAIEKAEQTLRERLSEKDQHQLFENAVAELEAAEPLVHKLRNHAGIRHDYRGTV